MKFTANLTTGGRGFWSDTVKTVKCTRLVVNPYDDTNTYGELQVVFDARTWNPTRDGLIYTDHKFLKELKLALSSIGLNSVGIDYTEQGMQGDNYVSVAVNKKFFDSWKKRIESLK